MRDKSRIKSDPELLPDDVTVSPSLNGYSIGVVKADGHEFAILDSGLQWATAIQRAYKYSLHHGARVLMRRHGERFELLNPSDVWLGDGRKWHRHDESTIRKNAPSAPGVYLLRAEAPIFAGDTENVRDRLLYHLKHPGACAQKYGALEFSFQELASIHARNQGAARLIAWWMPPCNEAT